MFPRVISSASPSFYLYELWLMRLVLWTLIQRDIKLRYKHTALGITWVFLQPLATAGILSLVLLRIFTLGAPEAFAHTPYLLFILSGFIPWSVLSGGIQRSSLSLPNDIQLINKIFFPRIFLPLASVLGLGVDYFLTTSLLFIILLFQGEVASPRLLLLPLASLHLFLFACATNCLLAALNIYYRDFKHALPFFLQLWMYASPIFYPLEWLPPWLTPWYLCLNPLAGIIDLFRWIFFTQLPFPWFSCSSSFFWTILICMAALMLFQKKEKNFADRM